MTYIRFMSMVAWVCSSIAAHAQEPYPPAPPAPVSIVKAEYFFDNDPGYGNGTAIPLTPDTQLANLTRPLQLNGSGLNNGIHYFYLRTQDANGNWSLTNTALFDNMVVPTYPVAATLPNLVAAEYFIDNDPGPGNGTPVALPTATSADGWHVLVNLTGLPPSVHRLFIRTRDANGRWSLANYALFDNTAVIPYPAAPTPAPAIGTVEYYIDTDPGFGNGQAIDVVAAADISNFTFGIPLTTVSQGAHTIFLRSRQNPWSISAYADFLYGSTLPVHWLYVKGEATADGTRLTWATGEEQQTDKFIIEYSTDGSNYAVAGEVKATNQSHGSSYTFMHTHHLQGALYYRIRQTDLDARYTYSKSVVMVFRNNLRQFALFPNPATEVVNVAAPTGEVIRRIALYNTAGNLLQTLRVTGNPTATSLPVGKLPSGTYYLQIEGKTSTNTLTFVKQ
ncbi:MAG: T9SS type A sorting domain-containing protein [Niastella sp.]|nr:T9SS type A sorting domain-containing protein [Niastella sp.]